MLHPYAPDSRYLSFASPVLTQDVRLYGEPVLHLWSTIQRTWITYTPRLVDFVIIFCAGQSVSAPALANQSPPAFQPAALIDGLVPRNRQQPRLEARLGAKARELSVRRQKRFLRSVLGVVMIAEHTVGDAVDHLLVLAHQRIQVRRGC